MTDNLLQTPGNKKAEQKEPLTGLSPEKYGHSAYTQLNYTPDKLKENPLYI